MFNHRNPGCADPDVRMPELSLLYNLPQPRDGRAMRRRGRRRIVQSRQDEADLPAIRQQIFRLKLRQSV